LKFTSINSFIQIDSYAEPHWFELLKTLKVNIFFVRKFQVIDEMCLLTNFLVQQMNWNISRFVHFARQLKANKVAGTNVFRTSPWREKGRSLGSLVQGGEGLFEYSLGEYQSKTQQLFLGRDFIDSLHSNGRNGRRGGLMERTK
jgi:hypothetical protein